MECQKNDAQKTENTLNIELEKKFFEGKKTIADKMCRKI